VFEQCSTAGSVKFLSAKKFKDLINKSISLIIRQSLPFKRMSSELSSIYILLIKGNLKGNLYFLINAFDINGHHPKSV
jgi:hypothetical protein